MIDFRELVKAGVHFGHQTSRWCPQMAPYIWGKKNKVHLIDVSKTALQLEAAAQFLKEVASEGGTILWVGTKRPAQAIIKRIATSLSMPYVNHRWIGGTLNNFGQIKKSVTRLLHFEDIIKEADKFPHYTKKEINEFQKIVERLEKSVGGIRHLVWPVSAVVVVDVNKERTAVKEAAKMGIPVIALVDTNSDPSLVDYVIPANDDSPRSISIILDYLAQVVEKGKLETKASKKQKVEEEMVSEQELLEFEHDQAEIEEEDTARKMIKKNVKGNVPKDEDDHLRTEKKSTEKKSSVVKRTKKTSTSV